MPTCHCSTAAIYVHVTCSRLITRKLPGTSLFARRGIIAGSAVLSMRRARSNVEKELCRPRSVNLLQVRNVKDHPWSKAHASFDDAWQQIDPVPTNDLPSMAQQIIKQPNILAEAEDVWHDYTVPSQT